MQAQPPGFYPDPLAPGRERWWDGTRWGEHARKARQEAPSEGGAAPTGAYGLPGMALPPGPHGPGALPVRGGAGAIVGPQGRAAAAVAAPPSALGLPPGPSAEGMTPYVDAPLRPGAPAWSPAGFWRRLGCFVLDAAVVLAFAQLLVAATSSLLPSLLEHGNYFRYAWLDDNDWYIPALNGLEPALWLLYRGLLEPTRLRTLGQRVFRLRTLAANTLEQAGVARTLHRHLLYSASMLSVAYFPAGVLVVLPLLIVEHLMMLPSGGARQTGHDRLAGTVVEVVR